jgi:hypothetical protein
VEPAQNDAFAATWKASMAVNFKLLSDVNAKKLDAVEKRVDFK